MKVRMSKSRYCIRSKGDSKIIKHKIENKIEVFYSINFVGSRGDSKIIKHKIATKFERSYQNKNNTEYILYINHSKFQIINKDKTTKSQILNIKQSSHKA
jgi:hypothetical protein